MYTKKSAYDQFVFKPLSSRLKMTSNIIFPDIGSMLMSDYDRLIGEILAYFHSNYVSNELLINFLYIVQMWDTCINADSEDINLRRLCRDFSDEHSFFWDIYSKWYQHEYESIIERLYVLFVMLFRYRKLERYKKASVPNVDEFRNEWINILMIAREHLGMELSDIVMELLGDVNLHRGIIEDFNTLKMYYKTRLNNLLPNANNKYEIRSRREDRRSNHYTSFTMDRRPWLEDFALDELLYGTYHSPRRPTTRRPTTRSSRQQFGNSSPEYYIQSMFR